jgi:hypothetical protein
MTLHNMNKVPVSEITRKKERNSDVYCISGYLCVTKKFQMPKNGLFVCRNICENITSWIE